MPRDNQKQCLVCGQVAGMYNLAAPYLCRNCAQGLTPEGHAQLAQITKSANPLKITGMVFLIVAIIFIFVVSILIGLFILIVAMILTSSAANSMKPKYREFALRYAQERNGQPMGQPGIGPMNPGNPM